VSLLSVQDLAISFGGVKAVDGVSFEVAQGEVFAIIGPNGAGKSTIFNLISRFYDADAGRIVFDGRDITKLPPEKVAQRGIARTFQNIELFEHSTVLNNLLLGRHTLKRSNVISELLFLPSVRRAERHRRRQVEEIIDFLDLQPYREKLIEGLPYGVRKIVEIARGLASDPRLLLLDEPASGLSVEETRDMSYWIEDMQKDMGLTIVMVEHDMGLVSQVSDRVLAVADGCPLATGSPREVQRHPDVIEAYLGEPSGVAP
jgi:branched-chain amino acid transport system ATP-binding protein